MNKTKKILAGLGIIGVLVGAGAILNQASTDADIQNSIKNSILSGEPPMLDTSVISPDRFLKNYVQVAMDLGYDSTSLQKEKNLYKVIRSKAQEKGLTVESTKSGFEWADK